METVVDAVPVFEEVPDRETVDEAEIVFVERRETVGSGLCEPLFDG